jgi:hypothetical protein
MFFVFDSDDTSSFPFPWAYALGLLLVISRDHGNDIILSTYKSSFNNEFKRTICCRESL